MSKRIAIAASLVLAGCANLGAVSEFAGETSGLTETVRMEMTQLDTLCTEQAELDIVVSDIQDEQPLKDCEQYRAVEGRLAGLTLDVLDNYARALMALVDGKSFDVSPAINDVAGKVSGLRGRGGTPLVNDKEVTALAKIVAALFDAATAKRRDAALNRLVAEAPDLAITGKVLRAFFVDSPGAQPNRAQAPYANLVAIAASSAASAQASLRSPALRQAEPIRAAELLRRLRKSQASLAQRTGDAPTSVPMTIVAAIDAWQDALKTFSEDALKPDTAALRDRLKRLRETTAAARGLVEDRRN